MLGGISRAYSIFMQKGLYLPDEDSKAINGMYLYRLAKNEIFKVERSKITPAYSFHRRTKLELFEILTNDLKVDPDSLGFDIFRLPNR